MGLRVTLSLAVLVAALLLLLRFTEEKPATRQVAEASLLDGRSLYEARLLRWRFVDQPWHEVSRRPDLAFQLTEPIVDLAAASFLRQIIAAWDTAQAVATTFADDEQGRQETGLLQPELVFVAEWGDGQRIQIDVGAPAIAKDERFVRRDGRIYRASSAPYESLRVGLDDLRERAVFAGLEPQCFELRVEQATETGKRETVHLLRQGTDWQLLAPRKGRADAERTRQFLNAVLSLRADHFLPGVMRMPAREPDLVITVRTEAGEQAARLWTEQGQVFGLMPGRNVAFNADNRQYERIFANAAQDLRATMLLPLGNLAERCGEIVLDPGQGRGDRIRLRRDSNASDWRLHEPLAYRVSATPMNELLQGLNNLRAIEFVDGASAKDPALGLAAGRLQVSVRELDQREPVTLWIGSDVTKGELPLVYACRADEPDTVVLVPAPAVAMLRRPFVDYCAREVVRLSVPIERLQLRPVRSGAVAVAPRDFANVDGQWRLLADNTAREELGGLVDDVLRDLRGKLAVDLRGDPLGEPDWVLELCRSNGDVLWALQLWDRGKEMPLVTRPFVPPQQPGELGFQLDAFVAKALRELWQ